MVPMLQAELERETANWQQVLKGKTPKEAMPFIYSYWKEQDAANKILCLAKIGTDCGIPVRLIPFYDHLGCELSPQECDWCLFDDKSQAIYLTLDNKTLASYDNVIDDPFLALRTKVMGKHCKMDVKESWANFARFQALTPIVHADTESLQEFLDKSLGQEQSLFPYYQELPSDLPPVITVTNPEHYFDNISPYFDLKVSAPCDKIWWQISSNPDFAAVIPNFEAVQEIENRILLDALTETFFNPNTTYYFRVKSLHGNNWSQWSPPFHFSILKPEAVHNITFKKVADDSFEIAWSGSSQDARYHVFASNSRDFIPSIYYDKHIDALHSAGMDYHSNNTLISITKESKIIIDGRYAYYRVIAERGGHYAVPSPLIYVYDNRLAMTRDILQIDPAGNVQRVPFPRAYPDCTNADPLPWDAEIAAWDPFNTVMEYTPLPYVSERTWSVVTPYLLPENHPIKEELDRIFAQRVTLDSSSLKQAGFRSPNPRGFSKTVVTQHPKLPGYFVKCFLDIQKNVSDVQKIMKRIKGAENIKKMIEQRHYEALFKVPQKWIYPLPATPSPPSKYPRKNFILIAEDMQILNTEKNYKAWKGPKMTKERLDAFYTIVDKIGLSDSVMAFNVPFTEDEDKMAFIDTELWNRWPVHFERTIKYLSTTMQPYWHQLVRNHGPAKNKNSE